MFTFRLFWLISLGGAIGSIGRYLLGVVNMAYFPHEYFLSTLIVNVVGSTLIGYFYLLFRHVKTQHSEHFAMIGICGGFTTFSSFMLNNYQLLHSGRVIMFIIYFLVSVIVSCTLVFLGAYIGHVLHHKYE